MEVSRRLGAEWNALTPEEREVVLVTTSHVALQEDGGGGSPAVSSRPRGAGHHDGGREALHAQLHRVGVAGEVGVSLLLLTEAGGNSGAE